MTESKITIPSNMELVKISDTEYKIVEKKKELPKSWSEFCEQNPIGREFYISDTSEILEDAFSANSKVRTLHNRNLLPNKEYAEAILALCQLIQLRDCYRQGWKPDWSKLDAKYFINYWENEINLDNCYNGGKILCFKSAELRDEFFNNFKDLIKKTKPLFS